MTRKRLKLGQLLQGGFQSELTFRHRHKLDFGASEVSIRGDQRQVGYRSRTDRLLAKAAIDQQIIGPTVPVGRG